jgi:hypothetical protein
MCDFQFKLGLMAGFVLGASIALIVKCVYVLIGGLV